MQGCPAIPPCWAPVLRHRTWLSLHPMASWTHCGPRGRRVTSGLQSPDGAWGALLGRLAVRTQSLLGLQAEGHPHVWRTFSPKILAGDRL